tara:strand:- start:2952 stop:3446 length:495 start_codon:yes stop_codon:yes gene_type:complete
MEISDITDIVQESREVQQEIDKIAHSNINNYIIELIRISEKYKFHAKVKPRKKRQFEIQNKKSINNPRTELDQKVIKIEEDEREENNQYLNLKEMEIMEISYDDKIKVKNIAYKVQKPKSSTQELWEKEGFYQEKTTQSKVRVQLWPEHLPYDHFKRKRAFLFN